MILSSHDLCCRRNTHLILIMALIFFSFAPTLKAVARDVQKPNILIILADDLGWSDISPYGGEIATPNLHDLADNGLKFTQFHNTSKCFPSRASLLTGLYAQQVGMSESPNSYLENSITLAEVLKSAGYSTYMVGKHHGLENPFDRGFDRYFGLRDGATNHFNPGLPRQGEAVPAQKRPGERIWCIDEDCLQPYTPTSMNFYSTDTYTDKALEYLRTHKDSETPFFLYISYQAPHDPLQAWPSDIAKYKGRYKDVGYEQTARARYERQKKLGLVNHTFKLPEPEYQPWNSLSSSDRLIEDQKMAVYAAMIDRMDHNIGRVVSELKSKEQLDNTLILFASDNGASAEVVEVGNGDIGAIDRWTSLGRNWASVSNTPFRYYKNHSYQGGINTPLIAHWPDVIFDGGRVTEYVGHFVDIMATVVDISSAHYPQKFNGQKIPTYEGTSLLSVFAGETENRVGPLFWEWRTGKAVRVGNWKLVSSSSEDLRKDGKWELYDMLVDKTETTDLASKFPTIVNELVQAYQTWRLRMRPENGLD